MSDLKTPLSPVPGGDPWFEFLKYLLLNRPWPKHKKAVPPNAGAEGEEKKNA